MSEPKFFELPQKAPGGVTVRVWFKTYNDAFGWMRDQGLLGENSAKEVIDSWAETSHKEIDREAKSLRKRITKWITGSR